MTTNPKFHSVFEKSLGPLRIDQTHVRMTLYVVSHRTRWEVASTRGAQAHDEA